MLTTLNEIEQAIELSQFTKSPNTFRTELEIVNDVFPQLSEELKEQWVKQRLLRILKRKRQQWAAPAKDEPQLDLPGFENLPRRIFLRNGQRKLLNQATIGQVRQNVIMLKERALEDPKIKLMEAVLELMGEYTSQHPRITWGKVKELELQRRARPAA